MPNRLPEAARSAESTAARRALLAAGAATLGALLAALALQKMPAPEAGGPDARSVALLLAGLALAAGAIAALVRGYRRGDAAGRRVTRLVLASTAIGAALALGAAEVALRLLAVPTGAGLVVGNLVIPPTWDETRAHNRAVLAGGSYHGEEWLTYVVPHPVLGWTVGPGRGTPDGLYYSSAEGVRSASAGVTLAARRPALRIALVGDSYTFAMDGPFADSWGHLLEERLGPGAQVLNFGVDGYGVDQAYLRYREDVRAWRPDVVLFGLIQHDVQRTAAVYPFLSFGWDYPFAKPRFVAADGGLRLLNVPLPAPREILAAGRPEELPFVEYDLGFRIADWRWRRGGAPLVARAFAAAFPRWTPAPPVASREAMAEVSAAVLREFARAAAADGARARILYFPTAGAGDLGDAAAPGAGLARRMLADGGFAHLDLTACVRAVPPGERLLTGRTHYTRAANGAVADCVAGDLAALGWLDGAGGGT